VVEQAINTAHARIKAGHIASSPRFSSCGHISNSIFNFTSRLQRFAFAGFPNMA
jgi:hypothetical protein